MSIDEERQQHRKLVVSRSRTVCLARHIVRAPGPGDPEGKQPRNMPTLCINVPYLDAAACRAILQRSADAGDELAIELLAKADAAAPHFPKIGGRNPFASWPTKQPEQSPNAGQASGKSSV